MLVVVQTQELDVVWSSPTGMWAIDLAGPTHAGLLVTIDNGLGKTQRFDYAASTQLAWAAESAGTPWSERMPVSVAVTTTATQLLGGVDPDRASQLRVRDGIYEAQERRLIGFARAIQTFPGASADDTIRVTTQYHPGRGADRVLRGQVLSARTEDGNGRVFRQVDNLVVALAVAGLSDDPRLKRAAVTRTQIMTTEPGEVPAVVRTRFAFDAEGRQVEERRDGRVVDGTALDGDESILRRTYTAEDATTGVRDQICEEVVLDGAETVVSRTQRLFGDEVSVAEPCQSGKGWVREELGYLAGQDRWVSLNRTAYDIHGNPVQVYTDGVARTLGYDAHGLHPVRESVSPAGGQTLTWTATWDDVAGTLVGVAAPSGMTTHLTYDGIARLTSIAANGALPHIVYRYTWVGPRPRTETFTYDGDPATLGPVPATWTPDSGWRHGVALTNGAGEQLLTAVQLASDQWNVSELRHRDARGRVIALTTAFAFQGTDVAAAAPPSDAATQTLRYDPLDRVIEQVLATGAHKRTAYHPLGVAVAIDGLAPVQSTLDGQGRVVHTERTVAGTVESVDATYDAAGRILRFSLQGGRVRHDFVYDSLGRLIHASDPDVGPRTMAYDDGSRLVTSENGSGEVVRYGYDGAGRLLSVDGTGVATRYHYDAAREGGFDHTAGQLAWAEEVTGEIAFGYDALGQLAIRQRTIRDAGTTVVGREVTKFSLSGLPRSVDLGDGVVLPMRYDAAGRLAEITGVWSVASYSPADLPTREQFGNGVIQRYERDVVNRPTRIAIENAGGALYDVVAGYTAHGAIATLTDNDHAGLDHTTVFDYDGAGRLTGATLGTGQAALPFRYAYDGLQNMIRRDAPRPAELGILAGSYQYRSEAPRQLAQVVDDSGHVLAGFTYDGAGRQVQHGDQHLTYNALSQLIRVDGVAGATVEHRYGYDGQRVATRSAAGAMTYWLTPSIVVRGAERDHYVRVGDRLIAKITTSTADSVAAAGVTRVRIAVGGLALAWTLALAGFASRQRGGRRFRSALAGCLALLAIVSGCRSPVASRTSALGSPAVAYYHATYAAGPQLTTDAAGELQEERRSEPFGAAIDAFRDGAVQPVDYRRDPINALNKFTDPDTGWSDHGVRWLAPDTAQWHTPDPPATAPDSKFMATPWALHPYQYVNQNPIAYWDPDGRAPDSITWEDVQQGVRATFPAIGSIATSVVTVTAEVVLPVAGLFGFGWFGSKVAERSPEMGECGGQAECASAMYMAHQASELAQAQAQAQAIAHPATIVDEGLPSPCPAQPATGAYRLPGDVPSDFIIVRGGQSPMPPPGTIFSGSFGPSLYDAASAVPHGSIRATTAGQIRLNGGSILVSPELTRSGSVNYLHANVCEGSVPSSFGDLQSNPVPKSDRIQ